MIDIECEQKLRLIDARLEHCVPEKRGITTMTFSALLDGFDVSAALFDPAHCNVSSPFKVEKSPFSKVALKLTAPEKYPSLSLKVFSNGSVHVTGCRTEDQVRDVLRDVCALLRTAYPDTAPRIKSWSLNMLNIGLACPCRIRLGLFADECRRRGAVAEQPEKPPSCIVRHDATVLVYTSGKMVITGRSVDACAASYAFVMHVLEKAPHVRALRNENMPASAARFFLSDTTLTA